MQTKSAFGKHEGFYVCGELSLSGRHTSRGRSASHGHKGVSLDLRESSFQRRMLPRARLWTASRFIPANHIGQIIDHKRSKKIHPVKQTDLKSTGQNSPVIFPRSAVRKRPKRALEVAAAGGHNVLLIGPPGSGEKVCAKRLPGILPDMTFEESIETTKIHSIAGVLPDSTGLISNRPFRSPHHGVSPVALCPEEEPFRKPGEVSLGPQRRFFFS